MAPGRRLSAAEVRVAVLDCAVLALASVLSYWLVTHGLARVHSVSRTDDTLGGLRAVIATVAVCRVSYHESCRAAVAQSQRPADAGQGRASGRGGDQPSARAR